MQLSSHIALMRDTTCGNNHIAVSICLRRDRTLEYARGLVQYGRAHRKLAANLRNVCDGPVPVHYTRKPTATRVSIVQPIKMHSPNTKGKSHETYQNHTINVSSAGNIFIDDTRLTAGSKSIIDDILLWSNFPKLVILYFECVCMIFLKYRVSFKLRKCDFLKERV